MRPRGSKKRHADIDGSVAFEGDHARDLDLRQQGYTVLRFTDRQLEKEPGRVAADVARALSKEVPVS